MNRSLLRLIASAFAIVTFVAVGLANADLLAHYVDGTDANAAASVNLTTPSGCTASALSSVGLTFVTTTNNLAPGGTEWLMATANQIDNTTTPASTNDHYQFSLAAIGANTIDPISLTFDWAVSKWTVDSGGVAVYYQIYASTDGSNFFAVGSVGSLTVTPVPNTAFAIAGPVAQSIDLTGLSPAGSFTFRIALGDNGTLSTRGALFQSIKLNGAVLFPGTVIIIR